MFGAKQKHTGYPSKRHMNLYYKIDRTTVPATVALYVLAALVILLGLSKFLVYDLLREERMAKNDLDAAQRQLEEYQAQTLDYEDVELTYSRYAATEEEAAQVDRVDVLELIDRAIRSRAQVRQMTVSGSTVTVNVTVRTLRETAHIVRELENSPIVERTTVNTAAASTGENSLVTADILIELVNKGEEQGEEDEAK